MGLAGKKVRVFFRDGEIVKPRVAEVIEESEGFLTIKNKYGTEALPNCNVVRVEVLDG